MEKFKTLDEFETDYFLKHPDEIESYLKELFEEYAQDGNSQALLSSLKIIAKVQGVNEINLSNEITNNDLQKVFSQEENLLFENINIILKSLGYYLTPQPFPYQSKKI